MQKDYLMELQRRSWPSDYHTLVEKYGYDPKGMTKFYNHEFQWSESANRVLYLGLETAPPVKRCLDLGPAAGHFPHLLKVLGHSVHTLEVPNNPPYTDSLEMLKIPVTKEFILANTTLPSNVGMTQLDLVTATGICFDIIPDQMTRWVNNTQGFLWGVEEWIFLLEDLIGRCRPGARLHLRHNYNWPGGPQGNKTVWVLEQSQYLNYLHENPRISKVNIQIPNCDIWLKND